MSNLAKFLIGGMVGAIAGYMGASLIIYKLAPEYVDPLKEDKDDENYGGQGRPVVLKGKTDYTKMTNRVEKESLAKLVSPYVAPIIEARQMTTEVRLPGPVSIITEEEYQERDGNGQILYYYEKDGKYTDIDENLIENPERMVENAHLHFGEETNDPDLVYIKNNDTEEYYEVIRIGDSYSSAVLGIEEPEPTPKRSRKPRAKPKEVEEDDTE